MDIDTNSKAHGRENIMVTNTITVRDSFVVNALRNCGYNNYAAIADIIDNSIEPDVNATKVHVTLTTQGHGTPIDTITITDNGCGMDYDTMVEAMCLGSMTGKNGEENLGMYGTGMKAAALSLGKMLVVASLTRGAEYGTLATLDITDACENKGKISLKIEKVSPDQVKAWLKDGSDCGTIVSIGMIDRLANTDKKSFGGQLRNKIGEIFNKFITFDTCQFFVDGNKVTAVDLMANDVGQKELMGDGEFNVNDRHFSFNAYYLPTDSSADAVGEGAVRNMSNQGIYIYRQNRLIGRGLTFGLWKRHPAFNGLRIELFTNGMSDELIGTSFTKMVSEKSRELMSQSLKDMLLKNLGEYIQEAKNRQLRESKAAKETDPETKKMYENVIDEQNSNLLLNINRRREPSEKPKTDNPGPHNTTGPRGKSTAERKNKWLMEIREESLGRGEEMYIFQHVGGKCVVIINTDHAFYNEFYSLLPLNLKHKMAKIITCHYIAKSNVNYYGSEEMQTLIDQFNITLSCEVNKSLMK